MKNFKRKTLYCGIVIIFCASVAVRIQAVNAYRAKSIVTFYEEWRKHGKPVEVRVIEAKDIPVRVQFTVKVVNAQVARGFVTGDVKDALREGWEIYASADSPAAFARLKSVSNELDIKTGMFPVEIALDTPRNDGEVLVVFAHTETLSRALAVPNEVLDISGGEYFLWKDEKGFAKKRKVSLGSRNGYGSVISQGVRAGDTVIFTGQSGLNEEDKLRVVNAP
ncbi:MAG TPA: hypothetical protein PLT76_01820 [Candidatus Omnitrophota bacterium]|nr:hypothetical protein [Candidatus Omnitrophota bacterium]HQO57446.1 hypothetical protein [Candidatus Omnitrophota bacterium]HQP12711.1 hypothetical protein [Candidatus Omnitrophota bacterium]